jgi:hypothetical protein
VNNELESMWRKVVMVNLRFYPGIWLVGLRKTMKNLSHDNQSPGQGLRINVGI